MNPGDPCPVRAAGYVEGICYVVTPSGQALCVEAEELARPPVLVSVFDGQEAWLRRRFPATLHIAPQREGGGRVIPLGIDYFAAAKHLISECVKAQAMPVDRNPLSGRQGGWLTGLAARVRHAMRRAA